LERATSRRNAARTLDATRQGLLSQSDRKRLQINSLPPLPRRGTALGLGAAEPTGDKEV